MNLYKNQYHTFYTKKQAVRKPVGYSRSPMKPFLLMKHIEELNLGHYFTLHDEIPPFTELDFQIAHTPEYVRNFFEGISPDADSNNLTWSRALAETVRYTNSSLYHAQKYAVENPGCITFSPTSGFHHAVPHSGRAFCTFSGQVISAVRLFREQGIRTAWVDMDGHFGNSIEESRSFVSELNEAIPPGMNLNPTRKKDRTYLQDLEEGLEKIKESVIQGSIDSICFAQGADSHIWDDLSFYDTRLPTPEWVEAHRLVFQKVKEICTTLGKPVPLTLSLFGGYRNTDYTSVLNLHLGTLLSGLEILSGVESTLVLKDAEGKVVTITNK